jgi:hypothetical protein
MRRSSILLLAVASATLIVVAFSTPAGAVATRISGLQIPDSGAVFPETSIGTYTIPRSHPVRDHGLSFCSRR